VPGGGLLTSGLAREDRPPEGGVCAGAELGVGHARLKAGRGSPWLALQLPDLRALAAHTLGGVWGRRTAPPAVASGAFDRSANWVGSSA
jgi:hypothetical protein